MGGSAKRQEAPPSRIRRWWRRIKWTAFITVLLIVSTHQFVYWSGTSHMYTAADAPPKDVIIVLGASVLPSGQPSPMLTDRLQAAADLYHAGKAPKILVSGDHGRRDYDEVMPMARWLQEQGVPARDIFLDHAGFRTLDTMARAQRVFGVRSAIVVSNPFHVPRAVFLARSFGLDAVGVAGEFGRTYSRTTRWRNLLRESSARLLAFGDVYLFGTQPRFLGPEIDLNGDGRVTRDRPGAASVR